MNELVARKKRRLNSELEDDELALSEIRAEAEVSNCLEEARKDENGRVVYLGLSDEIPSSIAKLTNLKTLKLEYVQSLPKELWQLPSLERLIVDNSSIPTLPPDVEDLREIKSIEILLSLIWTDSGITNQSELRKIDMLKNLEKYTIELFCGIRNGLPDGIFLALRDGGLKHLKKLRLNMLAPLPPEIRSLSSLEELAVYHNPCARIPDEIGSLTNLQDLRIFSCKIIRSLPHAIGRLQNLAILEISFCREFRTIPGEIGRLENLEELYLAYCDKITTLPDEIGSLSKLRVLSLTFLGLESIPTTFGSLQNLSDLKLINCSCLESLPSEIGRLENLEELYVVECDKVTALPDEIGSLSKLRVLRLTLCGVERLPTTFGSLQNLSDLHLKNCRSLESLPSEIGRLENLEELYVVQCDKVTALPDEIGSLSKLRVLRLTLCGVERLPTTFGSLQNLSDLQLKNCRSLESLPSEILHLPAIENLHIVEVPDEARIEDFFVAGCNLQKSLVNVVLDNNNLGAKNELSTMWRFLSGCPKLERASLQKNSFRHLNGFISAFLQGGEDNPTAGRLRSLDVGRRMPFRFLVSTNGVLQRIPNLLEGEDPEALVALLNTHLQLEYKSASSSFPPQVQYLLDINRCGRILLEGRGITSIPLSVWCRVLERTNNLLDGKVERNASVLHFFLRNGPALATRGANWE
jgi:Leucine-rich repeat (LRR) protein